MPRRASRTIIGPPPFWRDLRDNWRAGVPLRRPLWKLPLRVLAAGLAELADRFNDWANGDLLAPTYDELAAIDARRDAPAED